jgi:hypothetical protein
MASWKAAFWADMHQLAAGNTLLETICRFLMAFLPELHASSSFLARVCPPNPLLSVPC